MCYSEVPKVFFLAVVGTSQAGAVVFRVVHWRTLRCPEVAWVRGGRSQDLTSASPLQLHGLLTVLAQGQMVEGQRQNCLKT